MSSQTEARMVFSDPLGLGQIYTARRMLRELTGLAEGNLQAGSGVQSGDLWAAQLFKLLNSL